MAVGSGDGDGYGYGYGYGDGYGSGDGDGDGDGDGSGYSDGDGEYWAACLQFFVAKLSSAQQSRASALVAGGARLAYWRSSGNGTASNGGSNKPVTPGTVEREKGPLRSGCGRGQLHATLIPPKWQGDRWWIVALVGEVRGDEDKYWALEREVIGECV